jgi:divalent metal cation (Fe/Co/Zn/Cd) transporter
LNYHCFRTRRSGNDRFIDFHAIVSGRMDVTESHELADIIEKRIETGIKGSNVTIHIEPCLGNCPDCKHPCPDEEKEGITRQRTVLPGIEEVVKQVHDELLDLEGVTGTHDIHVHRYDGKWEVQIDLVVPPHMMVEEGHEIADKAEKAIRAAREDLGKVTIHVEPEETSHDDSEILTEAQLKAQVGDVLSAIREVVRIDDIHIHPLDGKWELHLDLVVPPDINVAEGHEIAEKVKNTLRDARHELGKISVHIEPDGHIDQPV